MPTRVGQCRCLAAEDREQVVLQERGLECAASVEPGGEGRRQLVPVKNVFDADVQDRSV